MPKGIFTQGCCILVDRTSVTVDEITAALTGFKITQRIDASRDGFIGAPGVVVAYRPHINGRVSVGFINERWPDDMGDPKTNPQLFAAWGMGHLGPMTFPGNLESALQQCWNWPDGKNRVPQHQSFMMLLCSYAFGAKPEDPIWPEDCDALDELQFMTKLATALLSIKGAICYFNPAGETLYTHEAIVSKFEYNQAHDLLDLDVWTQIRTMNPNVDNWFLMDTVGMEQLNLPDLEACFQIGHFELKDVAAFLRNTSMYLLTNGEVINDGETIDGANAIWRACSTDHSAARPPRRVLRWFPTDGSDPPEIFRPT